MQTHFKESPFYEIRELLLGMFSLEVSPNHRQNVSRPLSLSSELCSRLRADPTLRLLLFCAVDQPLGPYARHDIAFPNQVEVRVNGEEVKANFKGLKNKPGSTRPTDITEYVRKVAQYRNTVLITYALTQKAIGANRLQKFNCSVYLVRKHSVEDLTKRITQRNVITKQSVINEMLKRANDPDIVVDSVNMSLKDPISTLRINTPCRSNLCNHNQCFDAESFLQLQEQAPTWQCPVCNKTVSFEGLAVDQYVQEILDSVPKGTDQVTIQPNGEWSQANKPENQTIRNGHSAAQQDDSDDDDDLIDITDSRISAIKNEVAHTPLSMTRTTPLSSREASTAPRAGSKRTSEVIDLTLSDDDEPVRPAKKVAYSTPSSLPDPSRRYQLPFSSSSSVPRSLSHSQSYSQSQSQSQNGLPIGQVRLDFRPASQNIRNPYGDYGPHPPPRHPSYSGQGSGGYPSYGSSSP
ncbi:zf-MIZ-domain-containing protein [Lojkania enalia]|uniref:Zf-MIZ-domain-containing protein n=1 Tax=Lojkania enalia TaxID=147567 RepID=A0A9P4K1H9_9PLEO|nr:zf-MIZ-domain-containing protein [Didymosphaeria enalia]